MSNFLGDVSNDSRRSMILSLGELAAREGRGFAKNMNFRTDGPSVILISDRGEEFSDVWHQGEQVLIVEGHDVSSAGRKKRAVDQELAHESGVLSDNGKFYKAAKLYKDGAQKDALQVQVYERLSEGAWYDKGIFDLVDADRSTKNARKVFTFALAPRFFGASESYALERMIPAGIKAAVWQRDSGKCTVCGADGLFFSHIQMLRDGGTSADESNISLRCAAHERGARVGFL